MKKIKTVRKVLFFAYIALVIAGNFVTPVYAANDPVTVVNNFSEFMFGLIRAIRNDFIRLWNCTGMTFFEKS